MVDIEKLKQLQDDLARGDARLATDENTGYVEVVADTVIILERLRSTIMAGGDMRSLQQSLWTQVEEIWIESQPLALPARD